MIQLCRGKRLFSLISVWTGSGTHLNSKALGTGSTSSIFKAAETWNWPYLPQLSSLLPSVYAAKIMYAFLFSRMFITYSTHLIILYFIAKLIWQGVQIIKLILCSFSQYSCYFLSCSPNIVIIICSWTSSVCVLTPVREAMFNVHAKLEAKLWVWTFQT